MRHTGRLLSILLIIAVPGLAVDLSGKWAGTLESKKLTDNHYMELKQAGNVITGTTGPKRDGQWQIKNARLDGTKLTFDVTVDTLELSFDLDLDGDTLAGTVAAKNRTGISWKMRMQREKQ